MLRPATADCIEHTISATVESGENVIHIIHRDHGYDATVRIEDTSALRALRPRLILAHSPSPVAL